MKSPRGQQSVSTGHQSTSSPVLENPLAVLTHTQRSNLRGSASISGMVTGLHPDPTQGMSNAWHGVGLGNTLCAEPRTGFPASQHRTPGITHHPTSTIYHDFTVIPYRYDGKPETTPTRSKNNAGSEGILLAEDKTLEPSAVDDDSATNNMTRSIIPVILGSFATPETDWVPWLAVIDSSLAFSVVHIAALRDLGYSTVYTLPSSMKLPNSPWGLIWLNHWAIVVFQVATSRDPVVLKVLVVGDDYPRPEVSLHLGKKYAPMVDGLMGTGWCQSNVAQIGVPRPPTGLYTFNFSPATAPPETQDRITPSFGAGTFIEHEKSYSSHEYKLM